MRKIPKLNGNSLWFAVTLQCLGKLNSGIIYKGKQRNIYEHIYKTLFTQVLLKPPITMNTCGN